VGASPSLRSTAGLWHVLDRVSWLQRQHVLWCWGAKGGPCNWTWFKRRVRAKPLCRWAKSASRRAVDAQWWPVFRSVRDVRLKLANSQRTHACAAAMCSMRFTHVLEHTSKKTSSVSRQSLLCRVNHVCTPSQNLSGFDSRLKPNDMSTVCSCVQPAMGATDMCSYLFVLTSVKERKWASSSVRIGGSPVTCCCKQTVSWCRGAGESYSPSEGHGAGHGPKASGRSSWCRTRHPWQMVEAPRSQSNPRPLRTRAIKGRVYFSPPCAGVMCA
jgi:hypothetical protein